MENKTEIVVKAFLVHSIEDIEEFNIRVTENSYGIIRARLNLEREKIINLLKQLKESGVIKSIFIPKNKKIQNELNKLTTIKRQITKYIEQIKTVFIS
jgi:hypothetical protein